MRDSVCKSRDTQRSACLALQSLQFHTALLNECRLLIHEMSGMPFHGELQRATGDGEEGELGDQHLQADKKGSKTCCTSSCNKNESCMDTLG